MPEAGRNLAKTLGNQASSIGKIVRKAKGVPRTRPALSWHALASSRADPVWSGPCKSLFVSPHARPDGWFARTAHATSAAAGRPGTFVVVFGLVVVWAAAGPVFHFSNSWQLAINTGTTIVTFLMVFLIQHTQNRDTAAIQLKLDELIRATSQASNKLLDLEGLEDEAIEKLLEQYRELAHDQRPNQETGFLAKPGSLRQRS